jgi:hypothetical protein
MARNGYSKEEAIRRITAQISIEEKRSKSSLEINNSGALEDTKVQVKVISDALLQHKNSLIFYMFALWPCIVGYLLIRAIQYSYHFYITRFKRRELVNKLKS